MVAPTTYRIELAYEGIAFAGYARQPGLRTVEGCLRAALETLLPEAPSLAVAGRTDRGVSALGQVVSFKTRVPLGLDALQEAISSVAPGELLAPSARVVHPKFHAQYSARARRYVYWHPGGEHLEVERMDRMLCALLGRRCFTAFARDTPPGKSTVRRLFDARARRATFEERPAIRFDFGADAFLRRQIRILIATVLREAEARADDEALVRIAATQDRRASAPPAPAEGLYLARVIY